MTRFARAYRSLLAAGLAAGLVAAPAAATPWIPDDDRTVLERLPEKRDPSLGEVKRLQHALAARPRDLSLAVRVARRAITAGRATGDPRFLGQAQAALAPWWNDAAAPADVLVLRATIRQSLHEFPAALADLDRALAQRPRDPQELLTRATILTVVARYRDAEADCERLVGMAAPIVVATCRVAIASVDGRAATAYVELTDALARSPRLPPAIVAWAQTLAAEIADRRGDAAAAERHFQAARDADPDDAYLRGAFADFLLDRGRPREAVAAIGADLGNDASLLRLALAEARLADATPAERRALADHRGALRERFAASRARGDVVHRREEARFVLEVEGDAARALALARANWEVQREPADLRILAAAAAAARDRPTLALVQSWQRAHGLEDARLALFTGAGS